MYKTKKAIKRDILDRFRAMEDHQEPVLRGIRLHKEYVTKLNSSEKEIYINAVEELVGKGLICYAGGPIPDLKLTHRGADLIYSSSLN